MTGRLVLAYLRLRWRVGYWLWRKRGSKYEVMK